MNVYVMVVGLTLLILGSSGIAGLLPLAQTFPGSRSDLAELDGDSFEYQTSFDGETSGQFKLCNKNNNDVSWYYSYSVFDQSGVPVKSWNSISYQLTPRACDTQFFDLGILPSGTYDITLITFGTEIARDEYGNVIHSGENKRKSLSTAKDTFVVQKPAYISFTKQVVDKWDINIQDTYCSGDVRNLPLERGTYKCRIVPGQELTLTATSREGTYRPLWWLSLDCNASLEFESNTYICSGIGTGGTPLNDNIDRNPLVIKPYGHLYVDIEGGAKLPSQCTLRYFVVPYEASEATSPSGNFEGSKDVVLNRGETTIINAQEIHSTDSGTYRFENFRPNLNGMSQAQIEYSNDDRTISYYCPLESEITSSNKYRNAKSVAEITAVYSLTFGDRIIANVRGPGSISPSIEELDNMVFYNEDQVTLTANVNKGGEWNEWKIKKILFGETDTEKDQKIEVNVGGKYGSIGATAYITDLTREDKGALTIRVQLGLDEWGQATVGKGTKITCTYEDPETMMFETLGEGVGTSVPITQKFTMASGEDVVCEVNKGIGTGKWILDGEEIFRVSGVKVSTEGEHSLTWLVYGEEQIPCEENCNGSGLGARPTFTITNVALSLVGGTLFTIGLIEPPFIRRLRGR